MFQLGAHALEREIRCGSRHDTEAALMLLTDVASRRAAMGNVGNDQAPQKLTRMRGKTDFLLPNSRACDTVGSL